MKSILATIVLLLPLAARAQTIDYDYARVYFDELRALGSADAGRLWGMRVDGPMMFVDPQMRMVVANVRDSEARLRQERGLWIGELPAEQNIANTSIKWAGRDWSMVTWPIPDNRYARARLLMHESFHRIQLLLGLPTDDRPNSHLGSVEGRIWTRLEWRALTEALLRAGVERQHALLDALTFRARRRSLFKGAAEDERLLELNEGLAEYTGLVLSGLPPNALYDRLAMQLAQYEQQENYARSFAYVSGPAYALLLDAADKPWRAQLNRGSDLSAMAAAAYGISRVDASSAEVLVARYGGARMIAEERAREAELVANEARLRARLVDGPTLMLPAGERFRYAFDPNGATPLAELGTVFESARITDAWGVLQVESGGVLLRREDGLITGATVTAKGAKTAPTRGEGWTLRLNPGWRIRPGSRPGSWVVAPRTGSR